MLASPPMSANDPIMPAHIPSVLYSDRISLLSLNMLNYLGLVFSRGQSGQVIILTCAFRLSVFIGQLNTHTQHYVLNRHFEWFSSLIGRVLQKPRQPILGVAIQSDFLLYQFTKMHNNSFKMHQKRPVTSETKQCIFDAF